MKYAIYIDIDDSENRLEELQERIHWALWEFTKYLPNRPNFSVDAYAVPGIEEWQAARTGMKL